MDDTAANIKTVIIDTNMLLVPATCHVDIFSQLRELAPNAALIILDRQKSELDKIIDKEKLPFRKAAKIALQLIETQGVHVYETRTKWESFKSVDNLILEVAKTGSFAVATQDRGLKRELRENHIPVIILRQKSYLAYE